MTPKLSESRRVRERAALPSASPEIDAQQKIQQRAYELYEERGREDGHAEEDWLRAEAEIRKPASKAVGAG
jgi:Protein of unknown function (DUF2934)